MWIHGLSYFVILFLALVEAFGLPMRVGDKLFILQTLPDHHSKNIKNQFRIGALATIESKRLLVNITNQMERRSTSPCLSSRPMTATLPATPRLTTFANRC